MNVFVWFIHSFKLCDRFPSLPAHHHRRANRKWHSHNSQSKQFWRASHWDAHFSINCPSFVIVTCRIVNLHKMFKLEFECLGNQLKNYHSSRVACEKAIEWMEWMVFDTFRNFRPVRPSSRTCSVIDVCVCELYISSVWSNTLSERAYYQSAHHWSMTRDRDSGQGKASGGCLVALVVALHCPVIGTNWISAANQKQHHCNRFAS